MASGISKTGLRLTRPTSSELYLGLDVLGMQIGLVLFKNIWIHRFRKQTRLHSGN